VALRPNGAPHKQDSPEAHGEPLGEEEVRDTKRFYGWPADAQFLVPDGVYQHFADGIGQRGAAKRAEWRALFACYRESYPEFATQFEAMQARELPGGWDRCMLSANFGAADALDAALHADPDFALVHAAKARWLQIYRRIPEAKAEAVAQEPHRRGGGEPIHRNCR
jgi:hypothetical protein